MGRSRRGSILSVEISATGVHAVALEREGAGARVTMCEARPVPDRSMPEARRTGLAAALRDIARAAEEGPGRASIREVRVVVSGPGLTLRLLRMPPMPAREIPAAVRYRLPEICTAPAENLALDILPYAEGRGRGTVLVAAFDRTELDEIIGAFQSAGLAPTAAIPLGVALVMAGSIPRSAEAAGDPAAAREASQGRPMRGVLEIGATRSCLVLEREGAILHVREFGLGGDHFTQALARELGLGPDEAEKLKRIHGIPGPADGPGPGEDPSLIPSIRNLLRPLAERLVAEVKRSVEFTLQEHGGPGLSELMTAGGGAALRGLDRGLEEDLGATVRAFRPGADQLIFAPGPGPRLDRGATDDARGVASQRAPCLGAAWEDPPINLIAPRGLSSGEPRVPRTAALLVAGSLALGVYAASLWRADRRLDGTLRAQESRIRALAPRSVSRAALSPEILRVLTGDIDFEGTFRELNALIPPGMILDAMRLEPLPEGAGGARRSRVLRVEGLVAGETGAAEASLARLLAGVEQSDTFANVQRVRSDGARRRGDSALRFAFTCDIEVDAAARVGARPREE